MRPMNEICVLRGMSAVAACDPHRIYVILRAFCEPPGSAISGGAGYGGGRRARRRGPKSEISEPFLNRSSGVCLDYASLFALTCELQAGVRREGGRGPEGWYWGPRDLMASDARVEALLARRRFKRGEALALGLAAVAVALGAAAWVADTGQGSFAAAALPGNPALSSFSDRFSPLLASAVPAALAPAALAPAEPRAEESEPVAVDRFASATLELRLQDARSQLSRQLTVPRVARCAGRGNHAAGRRSAAVRTGIPVPRPRPTAASVQAGDAQAENAPRTDDRSLLQKLSDLLPGRIVWRR